jgi:adenine-specific DNA-methyltransferase
MQTDNEKYNETVRPNTAFLDELKEKLPEFFTKEGSFDLDKFKNQLKDKNVKELSEGYQLDFIGKDYARRQAGEVPSTVIVPDEKQNKGEGKNSKNLFFTGDNLEVLRHLQNNYQNKIDVIYIDPPYNTGSDGFVYPDSFEYSDEKLKDMFGLDDDQVARLKSIQGRSSHSSWLTFMYPRLFLAKRLLSKKGIFLVSIDENEDTNLKELLDEIFGEAGGHRKFIMVQAARKDIPYQ